MDKHTINSQACQAVDFQSPSEISETLYYRRPDISLPQRTPIALSLLEREGAYGVVTPRNIRGFAHLSLSS